MADGLVDAGELIASLLARPAYAFDDAELVALFDAAGEHVRLAQALQAFALGEIDARGLPIAQGATSTTVWARERQRVSNRSAAAQVGLAKALPTTLCWPPASIKAWSIRSRPRSSRKPWPRFRPRQARPFARKLSGS